MYPPKYSARYVFIRTLVRNAFLTTVVLTAFLIIGFVTNTINGWSF